MRLNQRKERIERRLQLAGDWKPRHADDAENAVFDRCFALAEAARELERVANAGGSAGVVSASMGCATSAFESLANAMLMMRGVVVLGSVSTGLLRGAGCGIDDPGRRQRARKPADPCHEYRFLLANLQVVVVFANVTVLACLAQAQRKIDFDLLAQGGQRLAQGRFALARHQPRRGRQRERAR